LVSVSAAHGCTPKVVPRRAVYETRSTPCHVCMVTFCMVSAVTWWPRAASPGARCLNWPGKFWWTNKICMAVIPENALMSVTLQNIDRGDGSGR
jgi:hypothetical protein